MRHVGWAALWAALIGTATAATWLGLPACEDPILAQPRDTVSPGVAEGQQEVSALWLARLCVKEAGWRNFDDCAGIYQVLLNNRRRSETLVQAIHRHSPRLKRQQVPNRPWIAFLNTEGTQPEHWPADESWNRYTNGWQTILRYCRQLINGNHDLPCDGRPIAWGGRCDDDRAACDDPIAIGRGLVRCECGETRNGFWGHPRWCSDGSTQGDGAQGGGPWAAPDP